MVDDLLYDFVPRAGVQQMDLTTLEKCRGAIKTDVLR
jgi:hypothetical protein